MPITGAQHIYAQELTDLLKQEGLRVEFDNRNEKLNRKIRDAEEMKIPYMFIVGQKEVADGAVSVRKHGKGDIGVFTSNEILTSIKKEIEDKVKD